MKIAVYAGSFDPITKGHVDILKRASEVFGKIYVTVLNNPDKKCMFSVQERIDMIRKSLNKDETFMVESFDGLLVDYASKVGAKAIIRGLRAVSDFDYEFQMALTNRSLNPHIDTVFFMTGTDYSYLSSGLVKQIFKFDGDVSGFVPAPVLDKLKEKGTNNGGKS